jgi:hypothetical protein
MKERLPTKITFKLLPLRGQNVVFVKLDECPQFCKNLKWEFLLDPNAYTFDEFKKKLSETPNIRGASLTFYILNEKAETREEMRIQIPDRPLDQLEYITVDIPKNILEG